MVDVAQGMTGYASVIRDLTYVIKKQCLEGDMVQVRRSRCSCCAC